MSTGPYPPSTSTHRSPTPRPWLCPGCLGTSTPSVRYPDGWWILSPSVQGTSGSLAVCCSLRCVAYVASRLLEQETPAEGDTKASPDSPERPAPPA